MIVTVGSKLICCTSIIKGKYQHTHTHTHIYIYIYTHTHTHTHTHEERNAKNVSVKKDRRKGKTDKNERHRFD